MQLLPRRRTLIELDIDDHEIQSVQLPIMFYDFASTSDRFLDRRQHLSFHKFG